MLLITFRNIMWLFLFFLFLLCILVVDTSSTEPTRFHSTSTPKS